MSNKKQKSKNNYAKFNILFAILIVASVITSVYCGINIKSSADKEYLALQDHLLNRFIQMKFNEEGKRICGMESYGLSKENNVAVKYWCQDYNESHEPVGDKAYHTLYFNHPDKEGHGYAEAVGD